MSPVALRLADGSLFFVGLGFVVLGEGLLVRFRTTRGRAVLTVLAIVGMIFVVVSATPLPLWAYACWIIPALAGLVQLNRTASSERSIHIACGVLAVSTAGLLVAEIPHHFAPKLIVPDGATVYVLGDSISAGLDGNLRCWPEVLDEMTSFPVVNLAQAGATVDGAIEQAKGVKEPRSLAIIEIGGNDLLLREKDASHFRNGLETLVSSLRADGHQVLLFELPLFPFQNAYGRAQRRAAARHGARLLPKRFFTKVLGMEGATIDGLHLSQKGHNAMARLVAIVVARN